MAVQNPPAGYHAITPYLMVDDAEAFMRFLKEAFGAKQNGGIARAPDGTVMHADFSIGDSHIMFGQGTEAFPSMPISLYLYIADCDRVFKQAVAAGAAAVKEPTTEFYGDRAGCVRDAWGNLWFIGTHVEDVAPDEMERRMKAAFAEAR